MAGQLTMNVWEIMGVALVMGILGWISGAAYALRRRS